MAVLTTKARDKLASGSFVFPKTRRYPIQDLAHARNALARSSGKPEAAMVRTAVNKRYPQLAQQSSNLKNNATQAIIQQRAQAS